MDKANTFYRAKNKLAEYDDATYKLMSVAGGFSDAYNEKFTLPDIVYSLRKTFKERLTHASVLGEMEMRPGTDPSSGFCVISSYLIYTLTGRDKVWELRGTNLHWWLYHKQTGAIFDVTYTQFLPQDIIKIYKKGRPAKQLRTGALFHQLLKTKANMLAQRAGLE